MLRGGLPDRLRDRVRIAVVGGPSIAGEVAVRHQTCVVVTGNDAALLERLAGMLRTPLPYLDQHGLRGRRGLRRHEERLCPGCRHRRRAAEKEGATADYVMYNLAAGLFAQGLWEIAYLVDHAGGRRESVFSLPGLGTCM